MEVHRRSSAWSAGHHVRIHLTERRCDRASPVYDWPFACYNWSELHLHVPLVRQYWCTGRFRTSERITVERGTRWQSTKGR